MSRIGIITNPHSKLNKRHPERQRLLGYILGEHGNLELTNSLADLARVAQKFKDSDIAVVAVNGGDGTINRTLTAMIQAYGEKPLPKFLILRGGTINVLAENIGVSGNPEQILVRYIESLSGLRPSTITTYRTLCVGGHYGFLFGNGLVANYLEEFYKNKTGPLGAIWLIVKIHFWYLWSFEKFRKLIGEWTYKLTYGPNNAIQITQKTIAVMASTVEKMPLGPKLFPLARRSLDEFQFFSLNISARAIVWRLPLAFIRNGEGESFGKLSHVTKKLILESAEGRRQKYTLDGELFTSEDGKLEISLGPLVDLVVV